MYGAVKGHVRELCSRKMFLVIQSPLALVRESEPIVCKRNPARANGILKVA